MKRARRAILLGFLFLLGGAVVSVGIAEGIGYSGVVRLQPKAPLWFVEIDGAYVEAEDMSGTGWRYLSWIVRDEVTIAIQQYAYNKRLQTFDGKVPSSYPHPDPVGSLPYWSSARHPDRWPAVTISRGGITITQLMEAGVGWPLASFSIEWAPGYPHNYRGGKMLSTPGRDERRFLSWRPIPLGLFADTLFWSACLAAMFASFRLHKTTLRRRRGACLGCGYDLGGLAGGGGVCPECGGAWTAKNAL